MSTPPAPTNGAAAAARVLAGALLTAPLLVLVAVAFVLPHDDTEIPWWVVGVVAVTVVAGFLAAEFAGSTVQPLSPAGGGTGAFAVYQQTTLLRFVSTEMPLMVSLALAFVVGSLWPFVLGVVVGLPVMAFEVWPSRRTVGRVADRLEAGGVRSGLREAFDVG